MRTSTLFTALLLMAAVPVVSLGQTADGRYATHNGHEMSEEMPDGSTVQMQHYTQITFANDRSHPMDNVSSDCMGRFHIAADGGLISAGGTCTGSDAEGNSSTFWWRADKVMTDDCADLCGSWGYFNGTGKFKGIQGGGTWIRSTQFANGSSGTWEGKATLM